MMMRSGHHLASTLTEQHYLDASHVSVSNRAKGATVEELALQQLGIERPSQWRCQHYRAAIDVALHSDALLTIPEALASTLLTAELVIQPLPFELPLIETHIYWHQQVNDDPSHKWLREKMLSLF